MKRGSLERMATNRSKNINRIALQREKVMKREAENADGRPSLDLDWIERQYRLESEEALAHEAHEISSRIGVDAEKVYYILLCAIDVAQHWQKDQDNRFRTFDVSFDVSRLLGTGFNTVYEVLRETDVLWR